MTVSTTISRKAYNGDGVTTDFATEFMFLEDEEVIVYLVAVSGASSVLTLGTHYTLTGAGNTAGGTVSMITAPATGERLMIVRSILPTQEIDLETTSDMPPDSIEKMADKLTMLVQQVSQTGGSQRGIILPVVDSIAINTELPVAADRANKALVFDADGSVGVSTDDYNNQAANAAASAAAAATSESNASSYEAKAEQWANEDEDVEVETGLYSAKHWAAKSASGVSKVKVSSNDTTAGYLNGKLVAGSNITLTEGNDAGDETLTIASTSTAQYVPVRQTVLAGAVDSSGYANFLSAGTGLSVNVAATSTPIRLTAANGFDAYGAVNRIGSITADTTISSLTDNTTNYLYADIAADGSVTLGKTTLAPVYQWGGTYSTTSGQFTFNIQEMVGKVGNGSAAVQTYRVFIGEAVTSSGSVTSAKTYALAGRYDSGWINTIPSGVATQQHNLGYTTLLRTNIQIKCLSTDQGWDAGDILDGLLTYGGGWSPIVVGITSSTTSQFLGTGSSGGWHKAGTSGPLSFTLASWAYRININRGW